MSAGPTVRAARRDDAEAIVALIEASNRQHGHQVSLFDRAAADRDLFGTAPILRGAVAEVGRQVVGVALWCDAYESAYPARGAYLVDLVVAETHRRAGLGRALVSCAAAEVAREGGVYLWWNAAETNAAAHALYDALGATNEPVHARALTFEAFQSLAAAGRRG